MRRRNSQQELPFETGVDARGRRKPKPRRGSGRNKTRAKRGRRPRPERIGFVPHLTRPDHNERHPVHVTMRRVRLAPSFRSQRAHTAIVTQIGMLSKRGVRVIQYCIQDDHLHMMVEAADRTRLARSMQLLFSRIALSVNRIVRRKGSLFRDRHHRHELETPTEVRRCLVYIFFNTRKHNPELMGIQGMADWVDECTSAIWFSDWSPQMRPPEHELLLKRKRLGPCPLAKPQTWLANIGWQRAGGLIRFNETPKVKLPTSTWVSASDLVG